MDNILNQISAHIQRISKDRSKLATFLRKLEKDNIQQVQQDSLDDIKICGVDGGFLKKQYHGIGLILRRAVAAMFVYRDGKLESVEYHPKRRPQPEPLLVGAEFSDAEFTQLAGLKRVEGEIQTAINALKDLNPNVMILDGSIVLYPSNLPDKNSKAYETYKAVIKLYKELYAYCDKHNILLIGAVEDSRGRKFCDLVADKVSSDLRSILSGVTDTLLLYYLLKSGERTNHFHYSTSPIDLPVLKDLGAQWGKAIYTLYLRASDFDRPLRVEFLATQDDLESAEKAASIMLAISQQNRTYTYPSVLIDADARAKLTEQEISLFKAALSEKIGVDPSLFELRRELRPM